ncbi:MAG: patatin-like phospholipase family protein [Oscillospiraceae bacterium]
MSSSTPWFFKTSYAKQHRNPVDDPLLTQVVRATIAAPTYFPPLVMEGHCMVDGGVFACNPALCAYTQARRMYPEEDDFLVVSLGTGLQEHNRPCSDVYNWGGHRLGRTHQQRNVKLVQRNGRLPDAVVGGKKKLHTFSSAVGGGCRENG